MALSRQAFLNHKGMTGRRTIHVPELRDENGDDAVILRGMTLSEFEINQSRGDEGDGLATARVLVRVILNEDGTRVFSDTDAEHVAQLPLGATLAIQRAVNELSGLAETDDKQAAVNEEIAGESEAQTSSS